MLRSRRNLICATLLSVLVCATALADRPGRRYQRRANPDVTAPVDGAVSSTSILAGRSTVSWVAATDDRMVSYYVLRFALGLTAPVSCATGTALPNQVGLSYVHTGLTSLGVYSYRVCAVDTSGNVSVGGTTTVTIVRAQKSKVVYAFRKAAF